MMWLLSFISRHRRTAIGAIGSGMIGGVMLSLEPYFIGIIIDNIRAGVDMSQILRDIVLLLAIAGIATAAFFGQRYYSGMVAYGVHFDIRKTVFDNMVTLEPAFYNRYSTGDLISRMFSDMQWIWRLLALTFNRAGNALVGVVLSFVLLASVNLPLTLIVFTVLAISTSLQIRAGFTLRRLSEYVQDQAGAMSSFVQDSVTGVQTIKTFGREDDSNADFHNENTEYRRRWLFFKRRNEPIGMLPQFIAQFTAGIVVVIGGIMAVNDQMTIGNFATFLLYLGYIQRVLLQIGTVYQRYQQTRGALDRITPLLKDAEISSKPDALPLTKPRGDIRFDNVSYSIDDKTLLHDIDLHIPPGSVVGIVGPTGCGKTLLVNLLARVMDTSTGSVHIDGENVRDWDLGDLRRAIAYVPQETFLFSQPLHENVRMGKPDITDADLDHAVHVSRVSNDLPQLPHGLDTLVGEKGVMLSGGQKQRVAIARAIARDPAIIVLDDALSSVDTQTAADILGDLRAVLRTRTSLIIAHRVATVKDADFILVMRDGSISEQGTHADLIANNGQYAAMVARELRESREIIDENNLLDDNIPGGD
jgi:ATP-binding cassette, subfamily B, multidrug efflux pump